MTAILNLTRFAATALPSISRDDRSLTLIVVQARFPLPPAGTIPMGELPLLDDQGDVELADVYYGDPATSSLAIEGQSCYLRPGTDITLRGDAWAPGGRPAVRSVVGLRVGDRTKGAVVWGERVWTPSLAGLSPGRPIPFESIPLRYERCYGGTAPNLRGAAARASLRNPVGRGIHASENGAVGRPLPNIEDPQRPIGRYGDHPRPQGFGPVARHWSPRRALAGTYDEHWLEERVPLWPADFDERFFLAAPSELQATPPLAGGEPVRVVGMAPEGAYTFALPRLALQARFDLGRASIRRRLLLDGVDIDTAAGVLTMTWRTQAEADAGALACVVLRSLDAWELAA